MKWDANQRTDHSKVLRFRNEKMEEPPTIDFLASFGDPSVPKDERKLIYMS